MYGMLNKLNSDSAVVLIEDMNVIGFLQQQEDVTYIGEGGMAKESMSIANKEYHEKDVGIMSEANRDSGDVGTASYLSANPMFRNAFGMREEKKAGMGNVLGTSVLLRPWILMDDTKRMNFTSIQDKHGIPSSGDVVLPVRTGYEMVIGDRVTPKFCVNAKINGEVLEIDKSSITVRYDGEKSKKDNVATYSLSSWVGKEESQSSNRHYIKTLLKKGDKFRAGDNIVHDTTFFGLDIFNPKGVALKLGTLALTAFIEAADAHEDSASVSESYSNKRAIEKDVILSFRQDVTSSLLNVKKIGEKVDAEDSLFVVGVETSDVIDSSTMSLLTELDSTSKRTTYGGVISDIQVRYNCVLSDMSPSVRKLATAYNNTLKDGVTGKVTGGYSINGTPLMDGEVEIKYFITTGEILTLGDKNVLGHQLKYTIGSVTPTKYTTEDGRDIDIIFSGRAAEARVVSSPILMGSTNLILDKADKDILDIYYK
jgi:hypothetical protein